MVNIIIRLGGTIVYYNYTRRSMHYSQVSILDILIVASSAKIRIFPIIFYYTVLYDSTRMYNVLVIIGFCCRCVR